MLAGCVGAAPRRCPRSAQRALTTGLVLLFEDQIPRGHPTAGGTRSSDRGCTGLVAEKEGTNARPFCSRGALCFQKSEQFGTWGGG